MICFKQKLKQELDTILPTFYELFMDSSGIIPCFSYIESSNIARQEGDEFRYSQIQFTIKLWSRKVSEIAHYSWLLDTKMRELGFKRISYNELWKDDLCSAIFLYEGLGFEECEHLGLE